MRTYCSNDILGVGGGGKHLKAKLIYTSFIIPMTDDLILSIFRTNAQNVYHKVQEMTSIFILNILALLLFENRQCNLLKVWFKRHTL